MWKIRHKKTGLFYHPLVSKWRRTNLDKVGKIYYRRPCLSKIKKVFLLAKVRNPDNGKLITVSKTYNFDPEYWDIVEVEND